jgi:hypothetical protein
LFGDPGDKPPGNLRLPKRKGILTDQQQGQSHPKPRQQINEPKPVTEQWSHHGSIIINSGEHMEKDHQQEEQG